MNDVRSAVINAVRDHDTALYRDLPSSNHRHTRADRAAKEVLLTVMETLGLKEGTVVTLLPNQQVRLEEPAR